MFELSFCSEDDVLLDPEIFKELAIILHGLKKDGDIWKKFQKLDIPKHFHFDIYIISLFIYRLVFRCLYLDLWFKCLCFILLQENIHDNSMLPLFWLYFAWIGCTLSPSLSTLTITTQKNVKYRMVCGEFKRQAISPNWMPKIPWCRLNTSIYFRDRINYNLTAWHFISFIHAFSLWVKLH